jgi:hypothetical protein
MRHCHKLLRPHYFKHIHYTKGNMTPGTYKYKQCAAPQEEDVKYLGLRPDRRLTWYEHIFV